jgi:hypothetical protein
MLTTTPLPGLPAPTNVGTTSAATMLWAFFGGAPLVTMPVICALEFGLARLGAAIGMLYLSFGWVPLFSHHVAPGNGHEMHPQTRRNLRAVYWRFVLINQTSVRSFVSIHSPFPTGLIVDKYTVYDAQGNRVSANFQPLLGFVAATWFVALCLILWLRYRKVGWKLKVRI